jgi:hypothetical protein
MAMLVDVVQTPVNIGAPEGRYLFPEMTDKQKERFYHYFSAVDSAVMYGKTALQTGGAGKVAIVTVMPIFDQDTIDRIKQEGLNQIHQEKMRLDELARDNKILGFTWKTIEVDYYRAFNSCQAVMVWRGVK